MSYRLNSFVNRQEADALKEMIFNRVRERSSSMNEEIQSDVMDLARDSFVSKDNPFSQIINNSSVTTQGTDAKPANTEVSDTVDNGIGFALPQKIKRTDNSSRLINEQVINAEITTTMQEARAGLSNKKSFMGALNFLNSQAAISLIKTRGNKFEMLA